MSCYTSIMDSGKQFEEILAQAKSDENIIGFVLGGSRGKGFETAQSDYDPHLIVQDDVANEYKQMFDRDLPGIDLVVSSLSEFKDMAAWDTDGQWDRYDFAHVTALVDKTGEIQKLIDEKGIVPVDQRDHYVRGQLDAYLNEFFRSVKALDKGNELGIRLHAARSIFNFLNALFALHGRMTPFYGYFEQEIERYPLEKFPWTTEQLRHVFLKILATGDLAAQQELAKTAEETFRREGFGKVFDDWEGKDRWAMEYVPKG